MEQIELLINEIYSLELLVLVNTNFKKVVSSLIRNLVISIILILKKGIEISYIIYQFGKENLKLRLCLKKCLKAIILVQ